jgi:hypothetical protein
MPAGNKRSERRGGYREGAGAKPFDLDIALIEKLCRRLCTDVEIAGHLGIKIRCCQNHKARPEVERGRANAFISIRSKQFQMMEQGSVPMAIFLGKTQLGQRESVEIIDSRPKTYKYTWVGKKKEEQKTIDATAEVVVDNTENVQ